jgi:hypothetical protein
LTSNTGRCITKEILAETKLTRPSRQSHRRTLYYLHTTHILNLITNLTQNTTIALMPMGSEQPYEWL